MYCGCLKKREWFHLVESREFRSRLSCRIFAIGCSEQNRSITCLVLSKYFRDTGLVASAALWVVACGMADLTGPRNLPVSWEFQGPSPLPRVLVESCFTHCWNLEAVSDVASGRRPLAFHLDHPHPVVRGGRSDETVPPFFSVHLCRERHLCSCLHDRRFVASVLAARPY